LRLVGRDEELPLIGRANELAFLCAAIVERSGAVVAGAAGVVAGWEGWPPAGRTGR
jgi:hypothetical protein